MRYLIPVIISVYIQLISGCGKPPIPISFPTLAPNAHITATAKPELTPVTACGKNFIEIGGQVEDTRGNAVPNGSYSTGGFMPNGFYTPVCDYMVLDGKVCTNVCGNQGGW